MENHSTLAAFDGPLDLLLQLIEEEKMAITDVSLARVTENFLAHLSKVEQKQPGMLASFLVIATKLVYLKSRELLPYLLPPEDEGPSLADQLKLYRQYAEASKFLEERWNRSEVAYGRPFALMPPLRFVPPPNGSFPDLLGAIRFLLRRLEPVPALPEVTIDHTVSVRQKIESIFLAIKRWSRLTFGQLMQRGSKTEVIVSFLALLELVKQDKIKVQQGNNFEEMEIKSF